MKSKTMLIMLALAAISIFPGCDKKGPMEKAGEQIDEGVDKIQEKAEDVKKRINE